MKKKVFLLLVVNLAVFLCAACGSQNSIPYTEEELKPYAIFYDDNGYRYSSYDPVIGIKIVAYRYDGKAKSLKVQIEYQGKVIHHGTEDEKYINGDREIFGIVYYKDGTNYGYAPTKVGHYTMYVYYETFLFPVGSCPFDILPS